MKIVKLLTGLLVVTTLLAGCSSSKQGSNSSNNNTESTTTSTEAETSKSADAEARVVEHAMGSTTITGTPTRVVTLFQGATDFLCCSV